MRGQFVGTFFDDRNEAIRRAACSDLRRQRADGIVPNRGRDLPCNAGVGDDVGITLRQRYEDENAGAPLGMLQTMRGKLA